MQKKGEDFYENFYEKGKKDAANSIWKNRYGDAFPVATGRSAVWGISFFRGIYGLYLWKFYTFKCYCDNSYFE